MNRFPFANFGRIGVVALLVTAAVACNEDPSDPDPDPRPDPVPSAIASVEVIDTAGSIFRSIEVTLDSAAAVEVFYAPAAGGGPVLRMVADSAAVSHGILLPRLHANTQYQLAVRSFEDDVISDSVFRTTFETDSLPVELTQFNYSVTGTSTFPLLLVPFRSTTLGWAGQVAIDSNGEIVWYFESAGGTLVAKPVPDSYDMVFIENGFPGDGGRNGIVRVSPDRQIVALLERDSGVFGQIHHDMTPVDEERLYFLAYDNRVVRDTAVNGEAVWEWNMRTGAVRKRWSSWDFFDWDTERGPSSSPQGWLHANSISIGPRGNVVISSRSWSQVFSISRTMNEIEYRIGGPNATMATTLEDAFFGQHAAWELPGGRLLVFDNRGAGPEGDGVETSRALELHIQPDTAWMEWQYDPEPDITSLLRGGVYRLPSGNTVAIFASMPFKIHETTPDGSVVWTFTGDQAFTSTFRVTPWETLAGEVEVDAMP